MERLTEHIFIRLSPDLKAAAERLAKREDLKLATWLRRIIAKAVRAEG